MVPDPIPPPPSSSSINVCTVFNLSSRLISATMASLALPASSAHARNPYFVQKRPSNTYRFQVDSFKIKNSMVPSSAAYNPLEAETELHEYLTKMRKRVNQALDAAVPLQHPVNIYEAMRYSLLANGKRIRPILCLAACDLVGGEEEAALPAACALEVLQTMSLVIDDLPSMDNDYLRRGKLASHKALGEGPAVLASVAMTSLAFEHVLTRSVGVAPDRVLQVTVELAKGIGADGLIGGQLLDISSEGKQIALSELEDIHLRKASALMEASVVCGAIIGGGNTTDIGKLRRYGRHLGLMFQVMNDVWDVTKTSEEMGKPLGKDLSMGKNTYCSMLGVDKSREIANELLQKALHEISHYESPKVAPLYHMANYIFHL